MVTIHSGFKQKRVLVAGDFMLDRYTLGTCKRISPEAPVPIVAVDREEEKAGGAGNVVLNLISLGMNAIPFGRVGDDHAGSALIDHFQAEGVDTRYLVKEKGFQTPLKVRLIASSQQLLRVDFEKPKGISQETEELLLKQIPDMLADIDLVAISDYAKGFLTAKILSKLIEEAKKRSLIVISDPKGIDFTKYAGSTILKPNLSEALAQAPGISDLATVAQLVFSRVPLDVLMITRSEAGISLFYPGGKQEDHPVQPREVKDVTGAGDTVLATLSAALANKYSLGDATQLANIAAQIAVSRLGCARVTCAEIASFYTHD
jgi:D-beta-D-heptose 7-phosphate kinase/D-beta-D-heptose 1-phosphate adenosyltransferase